MGINRDLILFIKSVLKLLFRELILKNPQININRGMFTIPIICPNGLLNTAIPDSKYCIVCPNITKNIAKHLIVS